MTRLGIAGDWHGNYAWAQSMIKRCHESGIETILHLGDFGIWPGPSGKKYLNRLSWLLEQYGMEIRVTPGNHEDYSQINARLKDQPSYHPRPEIEVLARGTRFDLGGKTFLSVGGAPSIDRRFRTEGRTWWPEEVVTDADVERAIAGGKTDVLLTHDSPDRPYWTPAVASICMNNQGLEPQLLATLVNGREQITRIYEATEPQWTFHGHYHVLSHRQTVNDQHVVALNCDGESGNLGVFDTETNTFELLERN